MAYRYFKSAEVNLDASPFILQQGSDVEIVFVVEDENGPVQIPTAEWTVRSDFRDKAIRNGGVTAGTPPAPQPTVSIINSGLGGEILMEIPNAQSSGTKLKAGVYSIELVHSSGKVTEVFNGKWAFTDEVTGP